MRTAALGDIAAINPSAPAVVWTDGSRHVAFVPMAAVSEDGVLVSAEDRTVADVSGSHTYFERGDILLAKITPCFENGKAALVEALPYEIGFGSTEFHVIRCGPEVLPRYLFHHLRSPAFRATAAHAMTGTAGQKRVPAAFLRRCRVLLPALGEQLRIAALLDKVDAIRRRRGETVARVEELARSAFLHMFGHPASNPKRWPVRPLGELALIVGGGTPSRDKASYFDGSIYWASSKDMQGEVLRKTQEHITAEGLASSAAKLVPAGSLLVVVKSKILAHRLPVLLAEVPVCFSQDLKAILPQGLLLARYLARHMRVGQAALLHRARGANTEGLTLEHLRSYGVMMPTSGLMHRFEEVEVRLTALIDRMSQGSRQAEELLTSIAHRDPAWSLRQ